MFGTKTAGMWERMARKAFGTSDPLLRKSSPEPRRSNGTFVPASAERPVTETYFALRLAFPAGINSHLR